MSKVSISKAAKLAGISRTHLYRAYIKPGKISLTKDSQSKPLIDMSELMRVFPELPGTSNLVTASDIAKHNLSPDNVPQSAVLLEHIKGLEKLLEAKELELTGYREREKTFSRLLEKNKLKESRWWWFGKG